MTKGNYSVESMANSAIEALKLAFQQNPDFQTSGLILAALAMVTQMREELADLQENCCFCTPREPCFPA